MGFFAPEHECMPLDALRMKQRQRLQTTVQNAYEHVPFYRDALNKAGVSPSDIRDLSDIRHLPFTCKTDLRDNYPYGLFAVPREALIRIHASSGTTGKQTVVGYTAHDIDVWASCAARALAAAGVTQRDFVHISYGYGLFTGGLGLHYGVEKLGAAVIPVSTGNTKRQVQVMRDFGSNFLCCTPSYALFIGETMREMGIMPGTLPLRGGIFGAEPWTENARQEIQKLLGIRAYDIYGLSEIAGPGVAYECEEQNGLHIAEDYFYPEIIDPDTLAPLPDGQIGELVFTCIGKEALPLLRYRTRDLCAITHEPCACGRTLVRMTKPMGRSDDMLIIRGVNVFPSQVEHVLLELHMSANYQIVVDRANNLDTMEVRVEMTPDLFSDTVRSMEASEKRMENALQATLNVHARVRLVEPGSLPRTEGKAQHVVDKRPKE